MNNYKLKKSVLLMLLVASASVMAEDQYPASDFKPKVVFQDDTAISNSSSSASSSSASSSSSSSSSASDSQYPAANFQPKVVYSDSNYKHDDSIPSGSGSSSSIQGGSSAAASSAPAGVTAKEDSSVGYLLGLVVFGIAGFVLFKKGASSASGSSRSSVQAPARNASGLTGVAKYILKSSGTGVSRYLENQAKSAVSASKATGVAKYLASKGASEASSDKPAVTGVEKYMRKKG